MLRRGAAIVELLTAAVLLGIVTAACAVLMHAAAVVLRNTSEHAATDEAVRTAEGVVRAEVRALARSDLHAAAGDSIALRVFRGFGLVCDTVRGAVVLRYRGLRQPDPAKDSLLVAGEERTGTFRLASDPDTRCVQRQDEELVALRPDGPMRIGSIVLLFETGAYHIATHALRYRRGTESRQPLTDELLDDRASRFMFDDSTGRFRMLLRAGAAGANAASETQLRLLNR